MYRTDTRRFATYVLPALALILLAAAPAAAQDREGWEWISPAGFQPGALPEIELLEGSEGHVAFQVTLPGFWLRERLGPDQQLYAELDFPGLGAVQDPGAPKLPAHVPVTERMVVGPFVIR